MNYRWFPIAILILLTVPGYVSEADPNINIVSPSIGARLITHSVNVQGNATGSSEVWFQTNKMNFDAGTMDNVTDNAAGDLFINDGLYDDFNDNKVDYTRWKQGITSNEIDISEDNGTLNFNGTTDAHWDGQITELISTKQFRHDVSASLISYSGNGHDYPTCMGVYKNNATYIDVGLNFDQEMLKPNQIIADYCYKDSHGTYPGVLTFGYASAGYHNFTICWTANAVSVYIDDQFLTSQPIALDTPFCYIWAAATAWTQDQTANISASWDNLIGDKTFSGNFSSAIYDTGFKKPTLKSVRWNATYPEESSISIAVRSSDNPDMSNPNPWTIVSNNQTINLPIIKRYLQYWVMFKSADGIYSPVLHDVTIGYYTEISKVELSIDDQATWVPAAGTDQWHASLNLPENTTVIWARVTDVNGEINITSITVDVDTTPPTGWVRINHGDKFTTTQETNLTLNATDRFGVVAMIVSDDPDFNSAEWQDFKPIINFTLTFGDGLKNVYVFSLN